MYKDDDPNLTLYNNRQSARGYLLYIISIELWQINDQETNFLFMQWTRARGSHVITLYSLR